MTGSAAARASRPCRLCDGSCDGADLRPLQAPPLRWLFEQLAVIADRRGDPQLCTGQVRVVVPDDSSGRTAARGLLGGSELRPGQRRTIDLAELTSRLRARGEYLTPGAAAAHVLDRPLAERARARAEQQADIDRLQDVLAELHDAHPLSDVALAWANLMRTGTISRLLKGEDPAGLLRTCWAVLAALPGPGSSTDRRVLAQQITGDPHALDLGAPLAGFVLAVATAAGLIEGTVRGRGAWQSLGVLGDDALGGLLVVGLAPAGWSVPAEVLLGLTPRELTRACWPVPSGSGVVFVTENPSVLTAVADDVAARGPASPVVCTSGTPSALEIAALDALAAAGWQLRVRADFDPAGLAHVRALLAGVRGAQPWRMTAADYRSSLDTGTPALAGLSVLAAADTPWDPELAAAMRVDGRPAYEEALLAALIDDLRAGDA